MIPYLLAAIFIGLPVFFAELVIGQYSGLGPTKAFAYMAPFFKGKCFANLLNNIMNNENLKLIFEVSNSSKHFFTTENFKHFKSKTLCVRFFNFYKFDIERNLEAFRELTKGRKRELL